MEISTAAQNQVHKAVSRFLRLIPPGPAYERDFQRALRRTTGFGLTAPDFRSRGGRLLTPDAMQEVAVAVGDLVMRYGGDPAVLAGNCFAATLAFADIASAILEAEAFVTIGGVRGVNGPMFGMPSRKLLRILQEGPSSVMLNLHAWLTLPTHEVLDITLMTSMAISVKAPDLLGGIIADHPSRFVNDLRYKPMLVGPDFFYRTGLCVEGTVYVIG